MYDNACNAMDCNRFICLSIIYYNLKRMGTLCNCSIIHVLFNFVSANFVFIWFFISVYSVLLMSVYRKYSLDQTTKGIRYSSSL